MSTSLFAQTIGEVATFGTLEVDGDEAPFFDKTPLGLSYSGYTEVSDNGADCRGFITAEQPLLKVNYSNPNELLSIFYISDDDATLIINDPSGKWHCSDDASFLDSNNPGIVFENPKAGIFDIWVGLYNEPEPFSYSVGDLFFSDAPTDMLSDLIALSLDLDPGTVMVDGIDFGDNLSDWANDGECDDPRFTGTGMAIASIEANRFHDADDCSELYRAGDIALVDTTSFIDTETGTVQRGRLESSDPVLEGFGYVDRYNVRGEAGSTLTIDLQSEDFDTYLNVVLPNGETLSNDDYEGNMNRSMLIVPLEESGEISVEVSSYFEQRTGAYTLTMSDSLTAVTSDVLEFSGSLASGDDTLTRGEYVDRWEVEGFPGQAFVVDLRSDDFDTFVVLETPDGHRETNDDFGIGSNSQIVYELSSPGTYTVLVTSYSPEETGDYQLSIARNAQGAVETADATDSQALSFDNPQAGVLASGDFVSSENRLQDFYAFTAARGDTISLELFTENFDPVLTLITPLGEEITNDDFDGRTDMSRIDLTLRESGRYRVVASSYWAERGGEYSLQLHHGESSDSQERPASSRQVYGLFAGIADYPEDASDLELTDDDAIRVREALLSGAGMQEENAITLLNEDATIANFSNGIERIAEQADSDDIVVIFYSGHGNRIARADGADRQDPDGLDETLELYDGSLIDDDLGDMLNSIQAGTVLVVLDSCFSGGFAKEIVSAPGRMGLFSSEEDVTSQVAYKFRAGGYLSVFFSEAISERYADEDGDGALNAVELSQYLHDRYRADVKSVGAQDYVRTTGPQSSYQHLVVDRGGVSPYDVLFQK